MNNIYFNYLIYFHDTLPATLEFSSGLNVISGVSNTGKSIVLDTLDYMFGGQDSLRTINELRKYSHIILGLTAKSDDGTKEYTLIREINKNSYKLYEGHVRTVLNNESYSELKIKHNSKSENNISYFYLNLLGLVGIKLRSSKKNNTKSLTIRNSNHLFFANDTSIHKEGSPFFKGQKMDETLEKSLIKFLLTAKDDSYLDGKEIKDNDQQAIRYEQEITKSLIDILEKRLSEEHLTKNTVQNLLGDLEKKFFEVMELGEEDEYSSLLSEIRETESLLYQRKNRADEINELVARFTLLIEHYESDLERLESVIESGTYFMRLPDQDCSLCGAKLEHQCIETTKNNDIVMTIQASEAELIKIKVLHSELVKTIGGLQYELVDVNQQIMEHRKSISMNNDRLTELDKLLVDIRKKRTFYTEQKISLSNDLNVLLQIEELQKIYPERGTRASETEELTIIPGLEEKYCLLANEVEALLSAWNFPSCQGVTFDVKKFDFVIGKKPRSDNGKGFRSILYAAALIGLAKYAKKYDKPHFGFLVLDSPLLAYYPINEKESNEKEINEKNQLEQSNLKELFYTSLTRIDNLQIIIIENEKPSISDDLYNSINFTGDDSGRYGLL